MLTTCSATGLYPLGMEVNVVAALDGIVVVDLTRTLAGPFCTMMLGDMGADVIKIEEPSHGDETRAWTPFWNGVAAQFLSFNRNKRSITLNLKDSRAVDVCLKLASRADVMIESFRTGTAEKMGIGYEDVRRVNPRIVYCSISGFGRTGPLADKPGYDLIIQAYSGLMSTIGEPDGPPLRTGFSLVDLFAGMMAYGSITTALLARERTGEGQLIEASLLDGQVATLSYHAVGHLATGRVPGRMGSGHPSIVPYQAFPSSDGFFILGCANDGLWRRLCPAVGRDDLTDDPKFKTNTDRVQHRGELESILSEHFLTRTTAEWVGAIGDAGVPCGPINRVSDVVEDPQVLARNMMVSIPHPQVPDLKVPGSPLKLAETPPTIRRYPPLLGEHNKEILDELGYSEEEMARLEEEDVI